jgi:sulfate adenylyltransferase
MVIPSVVMSARVLRDVELVLGGVLPGGTSLGEPLTSDVTSDDGEIAAPNARIAVHPELRDAAVAAGGLVLLDEEMTPLAHLTDVRADGPRGLSGRLAGQRRRESGAGRHLALDASDRGAGWRRVLLLGRPLVDQDAALLDGVEAIVVPDLPESTGGVPTPTMVHLAERLGARLGVPVRTVPLAWRDPASDAELLRRLASWLASADVVRVSAEGDDPGATAWRAVAQRLQSATEPIEVAAPDADLLLRWRPPRSSRGLVMMFTGFSGSGKSTVARGLAARLGAHSDRTVSLLDGDVVRQMLSAGLGFDRASRVMNVRRIGYVGAEIARHGGIAICAPIAPYAQTREEVRAMAEAVGDFLLIHVNTPLEECERRDLKGLYAKARAGLIPEFTGISDPYDVPDDADLRVDTSHLSQDEAVGLVLDHLVRGGWVHLDPAAH